LFLFFKKKCYPNSKIQIYIQIQNLNFLTVKFQILPASQFKIKSIAKKFIRSPYLILFAIKIKFLCQMAIFLQTYKNTRIDKMSWNPNSHQVRPKAVPAGATPNAIFD
jgi:hypothetical protein